ncbi:MAG TPA: hypothetical protein VH518_20445, partial [Tepidisphaeraceae bacterium]
MNRRRAVVLSQAVLGIGVWACAQPSIGQIRSFGEAEGYGAVSVGARATPGSASIYHVTNLNDSGSGSFRDAVSQSNRVVVFDVGGYINLASPVAAASNLTLAGQTAPGGGIGITGAEVSFGTQSNIIIRNMRFRPGSAAASGDNGLNLHQAQNVMLDHVSIEFAPWNNIDAVGDGAIDMNNLTVQNSIIADPINQQFGAHVESLADRATFANNLWANAHNRQPMAKINDIYKNNVIYNYSAGYTTANTSGVFSHDIVNNYFIGGPATTSPGDDFFQINSTQSYYSVGNLRDANEDGSLNGSTTNPSGGTTLASPWSPLTTNLPTLSTGEAYNYVISHVGATPFNRDQIDSLVISQVQTLGNAPTGTAAGTAGPDGGLYTSQTQTGLSNNGFGTIAGGSGQTDTDNDGVPDAWESSHGMNPAAADSLAFNPLGYFMIEQYVNELAETNSNRTWSASAGEWSSAGSWSGSALPGPFEHALVRGSGATSGALTVSSGTASALSLSIGGNGPASGESVTVSGTGKLDIYDTITVGDQSNATLNISGGTVDAYNIVLGNTVYSPGATDYNGVINLSGGTLLVSSLVRGAGTPGNWNAGGSLSFTGGILKASAQLNVTAPIAISGGGGTFDTNGNDGTVSGAISGSGAITKIGNGVLNLTGSNSFGGGILIRQGSVGAGSDANLGGATSAVTFQGGLLKVNGSSLNNIDA